MRLLFLLFLLPLVLCEDHTQRDIGKTPPLSNPKNDVAVSPARIALLHMVNDVWFFQELAEVTLRNKRRYAIRHKYELVTHSPHETAGHLKEVSCDEKDAVKRGHAGKCFVKSDDFVLDKRAPTFGKIKLALDACVGRDDYWLLWTDADAMVVNQTKSLLDIVDDHYDIIVSHDWFMINAGVMLYRCSPWNLAFLNRVYAARKFDKALALDQSAFNEFFEEPDVKHHVKHVPKHAINVYTEEYRPGDFIVHFAGKLYEATPWGIGDIARQFDVLSRIDDTEKISHFFNTRYLLNYFSGTCVMGDPKSDPNRDCDPFDNRRLKLPEPLISFSTPNRYRQLEYRNPRIKDWKDPYDVPGALDVKVPRVEKH